MRPNDFESTSGELFESLANAVLEKRILSFVYKGKARLVKPYELSHIQGVWYLIADESGVLKHFAFNKLKHLETQNKSFRLKPEFIAQIKAQNNLWLTTKPQNATLIINTKARDYFLRKALPKNFHIIKDDSNALFVRMFYAFEDELFKLVKTWLPYISIQEKSLQERFNAILREYLNEK